MNKVMNNWCRKAPRIVLTVGSMALAAAGFGMGSLLTDLLSFAGITLTEAATANGIAASGIAAGGGTISWAVAGFLGMAGFLALLIRCQNVQKGEEQTWKKRDVILPPSFEASWSRTEAR